MLGVEPDRLLTVDMVDSGFALGGEPVGVSVGEEVVERVVVRVAWLDDGMESGGGAAGG